MFSTKSGKPAHRPASIEFTDAMKKELLADIASCNMGVIDTLQAFAEKHNTSFMVIRYHYYKYLRKEFSQSTGDTLENLTETLTPAAEEEQHAPSPLASQVQDFIQMVDSVLRENAELKARIEKLTPLESQVETLRRENRTLSQDNVEMEHLLKGLVQFKEKRIVTDRHGWVQRVENA